MKILLSVLSLLLALSALMLYFRMRRYLKQHENEPLEQHQSWLMGQMRAIAIQTVAASLLSLLRLFV